jgi:hypothetical protein
MLVVVLSSVAAESYGPLDESFLPSYNFIGSLSLAGVIKNRIEVKSK